MDLIEQIKGSLFTRKPSASKLILYDVAGVKVSVCKAEEHRRTSTITKKPLEDGSVLSQHIIQDPVEVTLRFEQCNVVQGKADSFGSQTANAQQVESVFNYGAYEAYKVWQKIEELWKNKKLLTLYTTHAVYQDVVCVELSGIHKAPYKNSIDFTAKFVKMNLIKRQTTGLLTSALGNKALASEERAGNVTPEITSSNQSGSFIITQ